MSKERGITLIVLIITVIIMLILTGIIINGAGNSYENSQVMRFTSYMKMIQKEVDYYIEENVDYTTLGSPLSSDKKAKLQEIINNDYNDLIETTNVESNKLRYFTDSDIYEYFDVSDVKDEIIVNFENREVISLNGVEKNGTMYYVENGL